MKSQDKYDIIIKNNRFLEIKNLFKSEGEIKWQK